MSATAPAMKAPELLGRLQNATHALEATLESLRTAQSHITNA